MHELLHHKRFSPSVFLHPSIYVRADELAMLHAHSKNFKNKSSTNSRRSAVKFGFGICMDVNPYQFKSPFEKFEFARFHENAGVYISCLIFFSLLLIPCTT